MQIASKQLPILLANASDCPDGDHATASTQHVAASSQYTSPNARG